MLDFVFLGFIEDWYLIFQIFILITIISFVQNHLGRGAISILAIGVMAYIIFFVIPVLAGGVFLLYLLLMAGISGIIVDFFFLTAGQGSASEQRPDVVGTDVQGRMTPNKPRPGQMVKKIMGRK